MGKEIEIELKQLVTNQQFTTLCRNFGIDAAKFTSQTNYYFDTPNLLLKKNKMALRIREKNEQYTLTLKEPHTEGILETHQQLEKKEAMKMIQSEKLIAGEVKNALTLKEIHANTLQYLGSIQTNRAEIMYNGGILVFDHSKYLDVEDYELEYEVRNKEEGIKQFIHLLKQHSISYKQSEPKIKRFFDRKKQLLKKDNLLRRVKK